MEQRGTPDWLARARMKMRAAGPSQQPESGAAVDQIRSQRVLDLAMRIAEHMLSSGASANDVTVNTLRIVASYDVKPVHVDVTYTSITVSYHRGDDHEPLTLLRVVHQRTTDFTALEHLHELIRDIEKGLDLDDARKRYAQIAQTPRPYRGAIVTVAHGLLAVGVCLLMGAGPIICAITFVASALVAISQRVLEKWQVPAFFAQAVGALIVTTAAMGVTILATNGVSAFVDVRPSVIVAAGIVLLLSGMSVVGSAQDALDGYFVTAAGRIFEVMILTLGIVIGITIGLSIGARTGYTFLVSTQQHQQQFGTFGQQIAGACIIALMYAIGNYAGMRTAALSVAMAAVGWLVYLGGQHFDLGLAPSAGLGALVGSILSALIARKLRVPALALTTACFVPLVPGGVVFRGLLEIVQAEGGASGLVTGAATLVGAASIGIALAAGTSLGTFIGRPMRDTLRRAARRRPEPPTPIR